MNTVISLCQYRANAMPRVTDAAIPAANWVDLARSGAAHGLLAALAAPATSAAKPLPRMAARCPVRTPIRLAAPPLR